MKKKQQAFPSTVFHGEDLRRVCQASVAVLERNTEAVNALNVYPVPDGDTGTNMLLTMRSVCEEIGRCPDSRLGAVAQAMARGALLGARGNSGVIASQFLRGMARRFESRDLVTAPALAEAFAEGSASAYQAVGKPVEGTMLTVMRRAAQAARRAVERGVDTPQRLFRSASRAAALAVRQTPELLPVLKQAGVVDAGGQGFALMLRASALALEGKSLARVRLKATANGVGRVRESFLAAIEGETYGSCIQFILERPQVSTEVLRAQLASLGDSLVLLGDGELAKVHLHSAEPEPVLAYARSVGVLGQLKVEDIDAQHRGFQEARRSEAPATKRQELAVVAVAWGKGLEALFRNLGATVVPGGQTMNPSVQQLLEAVARAKAETIILLPNNPNIIGTARQAGELAQRPLRVVPTRSVPQGVAALLAMNPEQKLATNLAAMEQAAASVRSGELVAAVREADVDGVLVPEGSLMGLLDDKLVATGKERTEVLQGLMAQAGAAEGNLVTLYWGSGLTAADAHADAAALRERIPGLEVEVVAGGQPHYLYIVSIE